MLFSIQALSMMDNDSTLDMLLSKENYEKLSGFFKDKLSMDLASVKKMKPLLISSLLINKIADCTAQSYEMTFIGMASKQKKEVLGLETVKEQMSFFDKITYKKQAEMLMESITEFEESKKLYIKLVDAYVAQDINEAYKLIKESSKEYDEFAEQLLDDRNANWISKIEKMATEKTTFFAVGAGHLAGEKGVINLLKNAGYTVNPVK